jgi:hypothetical protein
VVYSIQLCSTKILFSPHYPIELDERHSLASVFASRNLSPACPHSACESSWHRLLVISFKAHHEPAAPEPRNMFGTIGYNWFVCFDPGLYIGKEQSDIRDSGTFSPAKKSVMPSWHKQQQSTCNILWQHRKPSMCVKQTTFTWNSHSKY